MRIVIDPPELRDVGRLLADGTSQYHSRAREMLGGQHVSAPPQVAARVGDILRRRGDDLRRLGTLLEEERQNVEQRADLADSDSARPWYLDGLAWAETQVGTPWFKLAKRVKQLAGLGLKAARVVSTVKAAQIVVGTARLLHAGVRLPNVVITSAWSNLATAGGSFRIAEKALRVVFSPLTFLEQRRTSSAQTQFGKTVSGVLASALTTTKIGSLFDFVSGGLIRGSIDSIVVGAEFAGTLISGDTEAAARLAEQCTEDNLAGKHGVVLKWVVQLSGAESSRTRGGW